MGGQNFMYLLAHIIFGVVPTLTVKREMGQLHLHVYFIALSCEKNYHTKMIHDRVLFLVFGSQKLTALGFCLAWYKQSVKKIYIINFHRQRISIKHKTLT